jgi:hypothetical protein
MGHLGLPRFSCVLRNLRRESLTIKRAVSLLMLLSTLTLGLPTGVAQRVSRAQDGAKLPRPSPLALPGQAGPGTLIGRGPVVPADISRAMSQRSSGKAHLLSGQPTTTRPAFFSAPTYSSGGRYANQAAAADLNGDGKLDLAVANECGDQTCDGSVDVLLGNGDGTFSAAVSYSSGGITALSVAVGDVNGDGKPDIVVANQCADSTCANGGSVAVLLGNGDGTFNTAVSYASGGRYAYSVAVADVNGDAKPDVVIANDCISQRDCANGLVSLLINNGDGTFQTAVSYSSGGSYAFSVAVGDLNGDGKPDLVLANNCVSNSNCTMGSVGVLLGSGDGTFKAAVTYGSGGQSAYSVAIGDVNSDGIQDLVVANNCIGNHNCTNGAVGVLLGNGDGTFQAAVGYSSGGLNAISVAVRDVNGDGKPDLIVANCNASSYTSDGSVGVLLGNGDGTFQSAVNRSSGGLYVFSVAVGDVNGDGKPDLVVANHCTDSNCTNGSVGVLVGNGDGSFQAAPIYPVGGSQAVSVAAGDFNGDGNFDLVVASECSVGNCVNGWLTVLLGQGDGTFQAAGTYSSQGYQTLKVIVGDFNRDGKPDLAAVSYCADTSCTNGLVSVFLGNGDGTFQAPSSFTSGAQYALSMAVGDVNGDGKPDLIVVNACATSINCNTSVLLGNGDGTFQPAASYGSGGTYPESVAVADINADGNLDIVVANYYALSNSHDGSIGVLLGNGDGTFQAPVSYSSGGQNANTVTVGDVNNDGKPDLMVATECLQAFRQNCTNSLVSVLLGNGDGTFQNALETVMPPGGGIQSLALGDFDGDGKLDVASGLNNLLLTGNGDGTFQTPVSLGATGPGIVAGDFNHDGKPDLAVAAGSIVTILRNIAANFHYATTTAVISSANPARGGQPVTFTATVTPAFSGPPTGAVTFYDGPNVIGTGTLSGNQATFTTSSLTVGAHPITASYGGDTSFLSSTSPVLKETITSSPTTTTLASSPNPSTYGQSVALTATVTSSGSGTPTGTITFTDGANTLGTSPLSGGQATLTTSMLGAGPHSITATYSGDSGFNPSTSSALAQTVNQANTALALASSVNPSAYSQSVTFTATITPQFGGVATGTVTFKDGATVIGSAAVSSNAASFTTNALALGSHSVIAFYSGDSNFTGSTSGPVSQVVNQAGTTTVVASSLNPAYLNQSITFTATVTGLYGGSATGSVTFKVGNTTLGTATLNSSGQASLTTSFSTAGPRSITAIYVGDVNYHGSTSAVLIQAVNRFPTTTTVGSSLSPSLVGQSVTFTATVSSTYGSIPDGDKVTFKDGATVLATVILSGGTASYTTSSLAAGTHNIIASYLGDPSFQPSAGAFKQIVHKNPSSAAVVSSLNPSTYGQAVTFTATISGSAGTATGAVTFKNGPAVLATVSLSGGTASITTSTLSAGIHSITVVYSGDSTYLGSTSPAVSQKVNRASTGTSISSSQNPSASGQPVTFTATVISAASGVSGTVTFKSGATVLGTGTLNSSGVATVTTSTLPVGTDPITAGYGGNGNFLPSSASMTQVVTP